MGSTHSLCALGMPAATTTPNKKRPRHLHFHQAQAWSGAVLENDALHGVHTAVHEANVLLVKQCAGRVIGEGSVWVRAQGGGEFETQTHKNDSKGGRESWCAPKNNKEREGEEREAR